MVANMVKKIKKEAKKVVLKNATGDYVCPVIDPLDALPAQDDKAGKFLKTDGEQASWEDIPPATMLNIKKDLMKANGKKVQFVCSEEAPVTVKFVDGTEQELTNIGDLDVSVLDAGTYPFGCNKSGAPSVSPINGDLTISTTDIASNFSRANFVYGTFNQGENNWEIVTKIKTPTTITQFNDIIGALSAFSLAIGLDNNTNKFNLALGNNGSSWNIGSINGTTTFNLDTWYYLKATFDGATYTLSSSLNGEIYITEVTINSTEKLVNSPRLSIGNYLPGTVWFDGKVDLSQTYFKVGDTITWNGAWLLNESYPRLGTVTLTADGITNITNNYQVEAINPLETVNIYTKEAYSKVTEEEPSELALIPFTFIDLDYNTFVSVAANTDVVFQKDGRLNTPSISTVTIKTDLGNVTYYGVDLPIRAGTHFASSVAGKFYYFIGQD